MCRAPPARNVLQARDGPLLIVVVVVIYCTSSRAARIYCATPILRYGYRRAPRSVNTLRRENVDGAVIFLIAPPCIAHAQLVTSNVVCGRLTSMLLIPIYSPLLLPLPRPAEHDGCCNPAACCRLLVCLIAAPYNSTYNRHARGGAKLQPRRSHAPSRNSAGSDPTGKGS